MWCVLSISLSPCKVKSLQEQMYLTHFIVKSPSVTNLRLTSWLVDVDIHGAIVGAHLMKDAFLCKAHFFTVIKLLQSKRFNSNCLAHKKLFCSMWHGHFSGFDWGALQICLKLQGRKLLGIRRWARVGFSFSFLTVSVLIGGKLYDLL